MTSEHPTLIVLVSHVWKHDMFLKSLQYLSADLLLKSYRAQETWGHGLICVILCGCLTSSVSVRMEEARANRVPV